MESIFLRINRKTNKRNEFKESRPSLHVSLVYKSLNNHGLLRNMNWTNPAIIVLQKFDHHFTKLSTSQIATILFDRWIIFCRTSHSDKSLKTIATKWNNSYSHYLLVLGLKRGSYCLSTLQSSFFSSQIFKERYAKKRSYILSFFLSTSYLH